MELNQVILKSKTHYRDKVDDKEVLTPPNLSANVFINKDEKVITLNPAQVTLSRIREFQRNYLANAYWKTSKRILDVIFSSLVVVFVLSWLYPILYIFIKAESNGPVIFKQKRNGLDGKPFDCLKFRSMKMNDFADSLPTFKGDPRITKLGAFIRKYSIDELPQFINVLKGDMTIVGPRPHMISETQEFNKISSHFYLRHQVKPGITGLAQINNCRGKINSIKDLNDRLKFDLLYIRKASVNYDLNIIGNTCIKMLMGDKKAC